MKKLFIMAMMAALPFTAMAQHEEDSENGAVSLAGRDGFTFRTKNSDFVFKPYLLVQTCGNINYYDDEGLDKAYNQDNIANSGFSIPYAILGFTGKAWGKGFVQPVYQCSGQRWQHSSAGMVRCSPEKTVCHPCG